MIARLFVCNYLPRYTCAHLQVFSLSPTFFIKLALCFTIYSMQSLTRISGLLLHWIRDLVIFLHYLISFLVLTMFNYFIWFYSVLPNINDVSFSVLIAIIIMRTSQLFLSYSSCHIFLQTHNTMYSTIPLQKHLICFLFRSDDFLYDYLNSIPLYDIYITIFAIQFAWCMILFYTASHVRYSFLSPFLHFCFVNIYNSMIFQFLLLVWCSSICYTWQLLFANIYF